MLLWYTWTRLQLVGTTTPPSVSVSCGPSFPMSHCPGVPVFRCPGVPVSRCPGVPVSRCPSVLVYSVQCPGVPVAQCLGVQVSRYPSVLVSKCLVVQVFRCPSVPVISGDGAAYKLFYWRVYSTSRSHRSLYRGGVHLKIQPSTMKNERMLAKKALWSLLYTSPFFMHYLLFK